MPSQNTVKTYVEGGVYHVYNRGVEKRLLFTKPADYQRFIKYFEAYLGHQPVRNNAGQVYPKLNDEVELLAFCLMPNHIHLMIRQKTERGIVDFMHRLMTGYSMYFNLTNDRIGSLFQGTYKASYIDNDSYAIYVSRYIHLNPDEFSFTKCLNYPFSSLQYYAQGRYPSWLTYHFINGYFTSSRSYRDYCDHLKTTVKTSNHPSLTLSGPRG